MVTAPGGPPPTLPGYRPPPGAAAALRNRISPPPGSTVFPPRPGAAGPGCCGASGMGEASGNRSRETGAGDHPPPPPGPEDAAPSPPRGPSSYRAATRGPPGSVCGRSCACPGLGEPGGGLRCLRSAPGTRPASPHLRHRDPPGAPPSGLPSGGS